MRRHFSRVAALILAASLVQACATLGLTLQGFNERLAVGYSTVTYARDTAGTLLDAGVLTVSEAENVQAQADNFRTALDLARTLRATDPAAGNDKLAATLTALTALADYLRARQ